ncbi:MAG: hypothetical protein HY231_23765 [Acidobacteria bacterium]|nr:hypothetical protein [Acidobacteriota bacterium]
MNEEQLQNIRTSRDAKAAGLPVFKVLSDGAIKAYKDSDGVRRFSITASSDADDLTGDFFKEKALKRMASTAKGITMFLNHSYDVPKDVFGAVEKASLERKSVFNRVEGKEMECLCLTYDGVVTEVNPAAVQTHDMMLEGRVTLGASVSVLIVEKSNTKDGRRGIDDVVNLECSIVGLPCNPTSWVESASKALKLFEDDKQPAQSVYTKDCPQCNKSVDTMHDFTQAPCPHCNWRATKGDIAAMMQADAAKSAVADHPEALPDTEAISKETAMETETHNAKDTKPESTRKGLFNDELQRQESSIWHLLDILSNALYDLYYEAVYYNTDVDASAELTTICSEFTACLMERFLPRLQSEDKSLEGTGLAQAKLENAAKVFAFLGAPAELAQKMQTVIKEGRRNNATDQKMIEEIHGLSVELGAACKAVEVATEESKGAAAPDADNSASQASGNVQENNPEVETLSKSLAETQEIASLATTAAEQAMKQRNEALELADLSVKALEAFAKKPMAR